jgi:adenine/guanine phosphoribosyltransferase-like PRPP-binding protein
MDPVLVEHIADCCYHFAKPWFDACDVIVSESDRGGGPMTHACALRSSKPYCLANWYSAGTDLSFGQRAYVGYSGEGRIFVNGVSPGQKVVVVDDMLSSGGTAEALFKCIEQAGGEIICSVFASEKQNQKGRERLARNFPHIRIVSLCAFNAAGKVTTAGEPKFPAYEDAAAPGPSPIPTQVAA